MKLIKKYLQEKNKVNLFNREPSCLTFDQAHDYLKGALTKEVRRGVESHIADCYHCLDLVATVHDGMKTRPRYRIHPIQLNKGHIVMLLAITSFILSFIFKRYFLQFLVVTILFGLKWVIDTKSTRMLVTIHEAFKKGQSAPQDRRDTPTRKRENNGRIEKYL